MRRAPTKGRDRRHRREPPQPHARFATALDSNSSVSSHQTPLSKKIVEALLGDYAFYRIFRLDLERLPEIDLRGYEERGFELTPVDVSRVAASGHPEVRARAHYGGTGALGFAVLYRSQIVCLQWFWDAKRYQARNFWTIDDRDAKSVDMFTVPDHRGQGLATALKQYSSQEMKLRRFHNLYSRVWHSNRASIRVNEKSGWRQIALVAEFFPFGSSKKLRFVKRFSE